MTWKIPQTAPRDGTQIIATFKTGTSPMIAIYSGASKAWCAAVRQVDLYEGNLNDWYFENEYFNEEDLIAWAYLPLENAGLE